MSLQPQTNLVPSLLCQEAWEALLARLAQESAPDGSGYLQLHGNLVRYFALHGDEAPAEAADTTLDRVAQHLSEGRNIGNVVHYAGGVARLVCLERRRHKAQAHAAAQQLAAHPPPAPAEVSDAQVIAMQRCLGRLPAAEQSLLRAYSVVTIDFRRRIMVWHTPPQQLHSPTTPPTARTHAAGPIADSYTAAAGPDTVAHSYTAARHRRCPHAYALCNPAARPPIPVTTPTPKPTPPVSQPPAFATLLLQPGRGRDDDATGQSLKLPPDVTQTRLVLTLPPSDYVSYRVALSAAGGAEIFRQKLPKTALKAGQLTFVVTAARLAPGDYVVRLYGQTADQTEESISDYFFRVQRK